MVPIEAKTHDQICELKRDNVESGDFWMLLGEGELTICEQKSGSNPEQSLTIPRKNFDALVRWYMTGKKTR